MRYKTSDFTVGPETTPRPIKNLILATCGISLAVSIGNILFYHLFGISGPEEWLSLSWHGISQYFLWQPFTFLFVQYTWGYGITLSYLVTLLFQMYILWALGSQVLERVGRTSFLKFYFTSGILAGIVTMLLWQFAGYHIILSGPTSAIFAVLLVWMMIYPEAELMLFFLIPIKAKWLVAGLLGASFLISISSFDFASFSLYFFGCLIGYLYALLAWGLRSPFPGFNSLEATAIKWSNKLKQMANPTKDSKILHIFPQAADLEDDTFIDMMLEKISQKGEQSLTWNERQRMKGISEKKQKKNSPKS